MRQEPPPSRSEQGTICVAWDFLGGEGADNFFTCPPPPCQRLAHVSQWLLTCSGAKHLCALAMLRDQRPKSMWGSCALAS